MAQDLPHQFLRLRTTTSARHGSEVSPLSEALGASLSVQYLENSNQDSPISTRLGEDLTEQPIAEKPQEEAAALAAAADATGQQAKAATEEGPSQAITIPKARFNSSKGAGFVENADDFARSDDVSTPSTYRSHRGSISFDPEVRIENGKRYGLDEPLPKSNGRKARERDRSVLEVMGHLSAGRASSRARSEADRDQYDHDTGERYAEHAQGRRDPRYIEHQPRWPLLQTTVDNLALHEGAGGYRASSLTRSERSDSCAIEETQSPDSIPARSRFDSIAISTPETSIRSDWFAQASSDSRRQPASRSKSYNVERKSLRRQSRRRTTETPPSPASAFLQQYRARSPAVKEDGEGQEVGEYVLGGMIGYGGFSVIREASTLEGNRKVVRAVKIVRRQLPGKDELENEALQAEYEREIEIWRGLSHEHILPLFKVYMTDFATFAITHLNTGGTLYDARLSNRKGLEPRLCRRYAYHIASALRYLHEDMHIVHRDVKLENCLVDISQISSNNPAETGGRILLCDFGLADYMGETDESAVDRARSPTLHHPSSPHHGHEYNTMGPSVGSTNFTGSWPYASPEMVNAGKPILSARSDMWAFGVVCYAIITGRMPFFHHYEPHMRLMILKGEYSKTVLQAREHGNRLVSEADLDGGDTQASASAADSVQPSPFAARSRNAAAAAAHNGQSNATSSSDWADYFHSEREGAAAAAAAEAADTQAPRTGSDTGAAEHSSSGSRGHADDASALPSASATGAPPAELAGASELVRHCLDQNLRSRWTIRDCLTSHWLEPEMDASGVRPGWAA